MLKTRGPFGLRLDEKNDVINDYAIKLASVKTNANQWNTVHRVNRFFVHRNKQKNKKQKEMQLC